MPATFQMVSGDTASKIRVTCLNDSDSSVIDLTNKAVKVKWKSVSGVLQSKTMTVLNPATDGKAEYQFATGELYSGTMNIEIEITDSGSFVMRCLDLIAEKVRAALS